MSASPQQIRVISWLLTSKSEREPRTQAALAAELGVDPSMIGKWKADPDFLVEWNARYLRTIGSPATKMAIMETLLQTATDEDDPKHVQAAKAYFEIEGSLRPVKAQVDVNVSGAKPSELSDAQLDALLADKATDELAKRREAS